MFELIKKDLIEVKGRSGFLIFIKQAFKSPGFQVVLLYRASSFLRKKRLIPLSFILDKLMFYCYSAEIRSTAVIKGGFNIAHPAGIVIGGKVIIGENFSIRQNTSIGGNMDKKREGNSTQTQPVILDNVLVGCNTAILGPIVIGSNVVIGACSLVINDIPSDETWGGVPAKCLKKKLGNQ